MENVSAANRRTSYIRIGGSILTIALLVYLFSRQGWGEIYAAIQQISLWQLVLALLLTLVSRCAVAGRWHTLLAVTDMDVSWQQTLRLTFAGLFASNFLPTTVGGDVVRLAGAVQLKMDGATSTASLVVDRLIGMLGMALAIPLGAGPLWTWLIVEQGWKDAFPERSLFGLSLAGSKIWRKLRAFFDRIWRAFSLWLRHPQSLFVALLMTAIHMAALFATIALLLDAMNDPMPILLIGGLWSFVYFVTLFPISINGYGVQEVAMTLIFTNVGGISMRSGLTIALLVRTVQMLASLPGAAFVPSIMAGIRANEKHRAESAG
jgi:uncharacterized membrane protein YbhN (UPF0104 family)